MDLKMPLRLAQACIASVKPFSTLPRSSALISRDPAFSVHSRSCACATCEGHKHGLPRIGCVISRDVQQQGVANKAACPAAQPA